MVRMTEEEEELKTEVRGGVGCILLNRHFDFAVNARFFIFIARPKKLNCLSLAMIRKMTKTVKEWNQKNSGVQVVVVRGAGENFMSGRWLLVTAVMVVEMVMAMIMSMGSKWSL